MESFPEQIGPKQLIFWIILIYLDFPNIWKILKPISGFPGSSVVKDPPAMQELQEIGSIPGMGRSSGEGNCNPLHIHA